MPRGHKPLPLSGQRFGRLVAQHFVKYKGWLCRCDCGVEKHVRTGTLRQGTTKSCGCIQNEIGHRIRLTHGRCYSPEYRSWDSARQRCTNPNNKRFRDYGGRGIQMHRPWIESFEAFFGYLGPRPSGHTLDRIDVNGHYEPGNVRWATKTEQYGNQRHTRFLTSNGRTRSMHEWAQESQIPVAVLYNRIVKRGWDVDRALTEPVKYKGAARAKMPPTVQGLGL